MVLFKLIAENKLCSLVRGVMEIAESGREKQKFPFYVRMECRWLHCRSALRAHSVAILALVESTHDDTFCVR